MMSTESVICQKQSPSKGVCRILVAEGTASARDHIEQTLKEHFSDFEIEIASTGKDVKERLEHEKFDLVLYDREMSLLDGDGFLQWLRRHDRLKDTVCIMLCAEGDGENRDECISRGADDVIVKPLSKEVLITRIAAALRKSQSRVAERRKTARFQLDGNVLLRTSGSQLRGELINISLGGLLSRFALTDELPGIFDNVDVEIRPANEEAVREVSGFVIRIEAVETAKTRLVLVAIRFLESMSHEKKREVMDLWASIKA